MSSDNRESAVSGFRALLSGLVVFLGFGLVAAAVFCSASNLSVQDKAASGVFDAATISLRDKNMKEVAAAQTALIDRNNIAAAEKKIAAGIGSMKASKSDAVVPGSPTFMQQMKAASAAADEAKKKAEAAAKPKSAAEKVKPKPAPAKVPTPAKTVAPAKAPAKKPAEAAKPKAPPVKGPEKQQAK